MKRQVIPVVGFIALFAVLGFAREFLFVNVNSILFHLYYHSEPAMPVPAVLRPLATLGYETLYYMKYAFTAVAVLLYYFANRLAVKRFGSKEQVAYLTWTYVLMIGMAALAMGYGYLFNNRLQDDEYTLSRWVLGVAQSPIISLILLASRKLIAHEERHRGI